MTALQTPHTLDFGEFPEPVGSQAPRIAAGNLGVEPFFFTDALGAVELEVGEPLALEFATHRAGQVASLLARTRMDDLTTVFIETGAVSAYDIAALAEAGVTHLRFGLESGMLAPREPLVAFPDGLDLSSLMSLQQLEALGVDLTDEHLLSIRSTWSLLMLRLDGPRISPAVLGRFPWLRSLYVQHNPTFASDLSFLDNLDELRGIGARFSGLTDADLACLVEPAEPWLLDIAYNDSLGPDLSGLSRDRHLAYLDVSGTGADSTTIETLATNKRLANLKMQCTGVTDTGLGALSALPNIASLNLAGTRITDDGLRTIVDVLPNFRSLDIRATDVTPEGARVLSELKGLWRLGLSDPLLTVDYVTHMREVGSVTELVMGVGLWDMTDEQSAAFEVIECGSFPGRPR